MIIKNVKPVELNKNIACAFLNKKEKMITQRER